jgi:hypothetical protein
MVFPLYPRKHGPLLTGRRTRSTTTRRPANQARQNTRDRRKEKPLGTAEIRRRTSVNQCEVCSHERWFLVDDGQVVRGEMMCRVAPRWPGRVTFDYKTGCECASRHA